MSNLENSINDQHNQPPTPKLGTLLLNELVRLSVGTARLIKSTVKLTQFWLACCFFALATQTAIQYKASITEPTLANTTNQATSEIETKDEAQVLEVTQRVTTSPAPSPQAISNRLASLTGNDTDTHNDDQHESLLFLGDLPDPFIAVKNEDEGRRLVWDFVSNADTIKIGSGKKNVFIFFSLDCPYCHEIYNDITQGKASKLDVTWNLIPVNLKPSSSNESHMNALLVEYDNNPEVAHKLIQAASSSNRVEVAAALRQEKVSDKSKRKLDENTNFLLHSSGKTPTTVFQDVNGLTRFYVGVFNESSYELITE